MKHEAATLVLHVIPCPLCGSESHTVVLRTPDWTGAVAGEFQIVRCRACRHEYTNPAPVDASIPDCYPSDYGPHQVGVTEMRVIDAPQPSGDVPDNGAGPVRQPWYLSPIVRRIPGPRFLYRWVTDSKSVWIPPGAGGGRRALELGCSTGWFLAQLRERGWATVGVDLVEGPLAQARAAGFEVHHGTVESLRFDDAAFDAVFAWMVLEHVPRPRETLREIHRILRPGGDFAFSIPNVSGWEAAMFGRYWGAYELPRHLQHFGTKGVCRLLSQEGFRVRNVIHQPSFFNWLGGLASFLQNRNPQSSLGGRLRSAYEHNPPLAWYFVLGPLARLNAFLRQSGRLTIVATRE